MRTVRRSLLIALVGVPVGVAFALALLFVLLIVVTYASTSTGALVGLGVVLLAIDYGLLRWASPKSAGSSSAPSMTGTLALCWLLVGLPGMHSLQHRSTSEVVSQLSLQTGIELLLFCAVGAVSVHYLLHRVPLVPVGFSLVALPVWMIASSAWSDSPIYAIARGVEMVALLLLALATSGLCRTDPDAGAELSWTVMRWMVVTTAVLIVVGFIFGPILVLANAANLERFTWIGAHPGDSGFMMGVAAVILVLSPHDRLRIPRLARPLLLAMVVVALYQNQTRTTMAGFAAVGVYLLVRHYRSRPDRAMVTSLFLAGTGIVAAGAIGGYILRDSDASALWTLNGRTELWQVAYAELNSVADWFHGLGYGAGRTIFIEQFRFAGSAHNSLLGALVDLGLVGAVILFGMVVAAVGRFLAARSLFLGPSGRVMFSLLLFVLVSGLTSDKLVVPSFASAFVYLCAALGTGTRGSGDHGQRGDAESVLARA